MTTTPALATAALNYAQRGWAVFPVHTLYCGRCTCGRPDCRDAGKHPLVEHGVKEATTDPEAIHRWWRLWPSANVAVATGTVSGIIVFDIDPRHRGDEALEDLERQHGCLPDTVEVLTGGGGRHLYFSVGEMISNKVGFGPGLDVRGDGGYVVAPPSMHASGRRYEWEAAHHPDDAPLAPIPAWLTALTTPRAGAAASAKPASYWRTLAAGPVPEGQRNDALHRLAGHLLRRYVDPYVTLALLRAWGATACVPPLDDEEITRTVDSIAAAEFRRRGVAS